MKLLDKDVLYLDNHLLIYMKPHGLLTLPTELVEDSVLLRSKEWLKAKFSKPGKVFAHPVHRLDRVASGIVVIARTSKALSRLNEQIRNNEWSKTYLLRFEGSLPEEKGEINTYLKKGDFRSETVAKEKAGAKEAKLRYVDEGDNIARVKLLTGRYHQIRAQFASIGCPICGDKKYGAKTKGRTEGIDLHHSKLRFTHPVTKEPLTITSSPIFL